MSKTIIITGASSGFGALTARMLSDHGHTVYAGMRDVVDTDATAANDSELYAREHSVVLRPLAMDVTDEEMVNAAVDRVIHETGRLDVIIHNAGHMVLGPAEAFTVEQLAEIYDINVLSTQRVNRAALPHLRRQRDGLLIWVGSSSARGGTPPYLAPYFAAKAAEDALAVSYAAELARFGIETTIVVPGAFPAGTNHYASAGHPGDSVVAGEYEKLYAGIMEEIPVRQRALSDDNADPLEVARQISRVVALPKGSRPFRVHIDPMHDGAEEVFDLGDKIRAEFFQRIGFSDLLHPARE
ncbi:MAG: SDR family oxidoreductase [Burkholderiaceae bacterium]|jgi:NAD(P)-dependent dehydrogenase (short-subunit alcohol dehydrogenase family)